MAGTNKTDLDVEDPLEWWVRHASDYPILSKMAFDLFSCPAMSAECERVFSQTKKVITDERNRLSSDAIRKMNIVGDQPSNGSHPGKVRHPHRVSQVK
ncbi:Uncharacterized protein HZ326_28152 [Fusarium oxysporum f. sp. albedinis]|nr:Uncharacterized protein HZ326_29478 [Fusarium oxysporum f. sp. albedinis]KAJ0128746.1 Uncharacterized protein HZ326_28152 [Fusarium oxysporum f. sp. albedinis]